MGILPMKRERHRKNAKNAKKCQKNARHSVLESGVDLGRICGHEEAANT
jgi:hypothetical protein